MEFWEKTALLLSGIIKEGLSQNKKERKKKERKKREKEKEEKEKERRRSATLGRFANKKIIIKYNDRKKKKKLKRKKNPKFVVLRGESLYERGALYGDCLSF